MDVDARGTEFGFELACVIPYAYHLHTVGKLGKTVSAKMTNEMYYFSDRHDEVYDTRKYVLPLVPNPNINCTHMDYNEWAPPPYKEHFRGFDFGTIKPLLIVHNKYNEEWGGKPIHFLDTQTLEKIFTKFSEKFQIIYSRPPNSIIVGDHSDVYGLDGETTICEKYNVIEISKLFQKFRTDFTNFNHFQLCLHAQCDRFISVQGGSSYLASYFGGINIVYAKQGKENDHGSFEGYFRKFSGCDVCQARTYSELMSLVEAKFIEG
jgi:hypothetical protein